MPGDKLTLAQFAQKVKQKYPQYANLNDTLLAQKMVAKFPQYKGSIDYNFDTPSDTQTQQPKDETKSYPSVAWQQPNIDKNNAQQPVQTTTQQNIQQPAPAQVQTEQAPQSIKASSFWNPAKEPNSVPKGLAVSVPRNSLTNDLPDVKEAIDKAVVAKNKSFGVTGNKVDKNFGRKEIEADIKSGKLVVTKNNQGQSVIKRGDSGFFSNFNNKVDDEYRNEMENNFVLNAPQKDVIAHLNMLREHPGSSPFQKESETAATGLLGKAGEFVGENITPIVKGTAFEMLGNALAPFTGGGSVVMSAQQMQDIAAGGYKNGLIRTYNSLKDQNPNISDEDAYDTAKKVALEHAVTGAAQGAALGGSIRGARIAAQTEDGVLMGLEHAIQSSPKVLGVTAASSVVNDIYAKSQGVKVDNNDIAANAINAAKNMAVIHFGIPVAMGLPEAISSIPSYLRPQFENAVASAPREQVLNVSQQAEANGEVPRGTTDNLANNLQQFDQAKQSIPANIPMSEETRAAITGKMIQRTNLKKQITELQQHGDAFAGKVEELNSQVKAIDSDINQMSLTNKPFDYEKDNLTGEPLTPRKTFEQLSSKEKDGVQVPKEYGETDIITQDDGEGNKTFTPVAFTKEKQGGLEVKNDLKVEGKFKDRDKAQAAADKALAEYYYDNGLEDNLKPISNEPAKENTQTGNSSNERVAAEKEITTETAPNQVEQSTKKEKLVANDGKAYANTPRMAKLIERGNNIRNSLPPVPDGHTRLYRGNREGEMGENPSFTSSLEGIAIPFEEQYKGGLSYIDVPTKDLNRYASGAGATDEEFQVPKEIALTAKRITEKPDNQSGITVIRPEERKPVESVTTIGNENISSSLNIQNEKAKGEEGRQELLTGNQQSEAGGNPPSEPPVINTKGEKENDGWTAIRKQKLQEIDGVKKIFEKETGRKWTDIQQRGLEDVQKEHPEKTLYEAVKYKSERLAAMYDAGEDYNPTAKDLAVVQEFKRQTEKRISGIKDRLNSDNDIERMAAITEAESYNTDLANAVKALFTKEAGTAFGFRQSESKVDENYGLQIRRMELMKANGGSKLSEADSKWAEEKWNQEKEIFKKEQEAKELSLREDFEKKINDLRNQIAKKGGHPPSFSKEKTLSQKGKDVADRLRKLKTDKGSLKFDLTLGTWDLAIEGIAKLVEAGSSIAEAIDALIKEKSLGFKSEKERSQFEDAIAVGLREPVNREPLLTEMKNLSDAGYITPEMVGRRLIQRYVESFIGEAEHKNILDEAANGLKEILPNSDKKTLIEAYLQEGGFKQPTKKQLENSLSKAKAELKNIARLTEDVADLKSNVEVRQRSFANEREKTEYEQELISEKEKQIKEANDRKKQIREDYRKLETERNRQLKRVGELKDKKEKLLAGIRERKALNPKEDTPEIEGLKKEVQKADKDLREAEAAQRKIEREQQTKKDKITELDANIQRAKNNQSIIKSFRKKPERNIDAEIAAKEKELKKAIGSYTSDERQQQQKLAQVKEQRQRQIKEYERMLAEGEFNEKPAPVTLKKADAELIRLNKQKADIEADFRKKQTELQEKNKHWGERAADFTRAVIVDMLIGAPKTLFKVAANAFMRPVSEATTKLTAGKLFDAIFPNISKAAARGGESSSVRSVAKGFEAYFMQRGSKGMDAVYEKSNKEYETALDKYNNAKASGADAKELEKLKNDLNNKLLKVTGNFIYKFIGGSSLNDAKQALIHRTNEIERQFGAVHEESIKDGNWLDKTTYVLNFIGRSHSALKTFSGRFSFAAGFMARIEAAVKDGVDISNGDRVLEIAHESYLDWERGKYQQDNYITNKWNQIVNSIDRRMSDHPEWDKFNKATSTLFRSEVAITRVPVNILHEAVMEYTFGAFRAVTMALKEYRKANKQAVSEGLGVADEAALKTRIKEIVSDMDEKQAATIARAFRKGSMGIGLYAFFAISGLMHFGIFPHRYQAKMKDEKDLKLNELNPAQVQLGELKLGEIPSAMVDHIPALWPSLMGLGMCYIYNKDISMPRKPKTEMQASWDALYTHLQIIQDQIPQSKIINPLQIMTDAGHSAEKRLDDWGLVDKEDASTNPKPPAVHSSGRSTSRSAGRNTGRTSNR